MMNSGTSIKVHNLSIRGVRASEFLYVMETVLTSGEEVEVLCVFYTKNDPTTVTLYNGQLHLECEVANPFRFRTPGEVTVWLLADVIGSSSEPTREVKYLGVICTPFTPFFSAERIKEYEGALPREIPGVLSDGYLIRLISCVEKKRS
jgi:hypothetical protein